MRIRPWSTRRRSGRPLEAAVACATVTACAIILAPLFDRPAEAGPVATTMDGAAVIARTSGIVGRAEVVDGDGLRIDGVRIRLHGIDAFERDQRCGEMACGRLSRENLVDLVQGAAVACVELDTDRHGRMVARCEARGRDVGAAQVEAGHALAYRRYSRDYVALEDTARQARRGAWAADGFIPPEAWRRAN